jgi:hypothetical protein
VDFADLNAETLWSYFESKSCYGGALAYAVLSRARKLGCPCSVSLERLKDARKKQKTDWIKWCSKFCNILWARKFAFQVVSDRPSFKNRLTVFWSSRLPYSCPVIDSSEFKLSYNTVARIASLAVHSESSEFLDQVVLCAQDERRDIIPYVWSKLKDNFVCSKSWAPSFQFKFADEFQLIDPSASPCDIDTGLIAETWCRILVLIGRIFPSSHGQSDQQMVWKHVVCNPAFRIPVQERVISMWIWLLWSSNTLPFFLNNTLNSPPVVAGSDENAAGVEFRLLVLQSLRSKRLVSDTEFFNKRQCIISSL